MKEFDELVALMDRLRAEGGCPWDREQTPRDLRGYLLEESYEVVEAIDSGEALHLREELGDLLFQIVFLARISAEKGDFTIADVARAVTEKMTRRHPHVFGSSQASTSDEVLRQWEQIKKDERRPDGDVEPPSALSRIPRSLPSLLRAERLGEKAARVGFDWARTEDVLRKIEEEIRELRGAVEKETPARIAEEFGDLLLSLASLARRLGVHAEGALQEANDRFTRRFRWLERELHRRGTEPSDASIEELDRLWERAKNEPPAAAE